MADLTEEVLMLALELEMDSFFSSFGVDFATELEEDDGAATVTGFSFSFSVLVSFFSSTTEEDVEEEDREDAGAHPCVFICSGQ